MPQYSWPCGGRSLASKYRLAVIAAKAFAGFAGTILIPVICAEAWLVADNSKLAQQVRWILCESRPEAINVDRGCGPAPDPDGGQKIGLLEFDTFQMSDVANWLALVYPAQTATNRLTTVPVNGGVASPGPGEAEVLLDVDTVTELTLFTDTKYVVYVAPMGTGFQQLFNAMINDGDTIISNSWEQCEDQTSMADAQSIDSILAQAAASGISVFNATGDYGAVCFDGSSNTIVVPADSPHATAVGGTTPVFGAAEIYGGEMWWNNSTHVPPGGAGGYGISKYFPAPSYQNSLTGSAMRERAGSADPPRASDGRADRGPRA